MKTTHSLPQFLKKNNVTMNHLRNAARDLNQTFNTNINLAIGVSKIALAQNLCEKAEEILRSNQPIPHRSTVNTLIALGVKFPIMDDIEEEQTEPATDRNPDPGGLFQMSQLHLSSSKKEEDCFGNGFDESTRKCRRCDYFRNCLITTREFEFSMEEQHSNERIDFTEIIEKIEKEITDLVKQKEDALIKVKEMTKTLKVMQKTPADRLMTIMGERG